MAASSQITSAVLSLLITAVTFIILSYQTVYGFSKSSPHAGSGKLQGRNQIEIISWWLVSESWLACRVQCTWRSSPHITVLQLILHNGRGRDLNCLWSQNLTTATTPTCLMDAVHRAYVPPWMLISCDCRRCRRWDVFLTHLCVPGTSESSQWGHTASPHTTPPR